MNVMRAKMEIREICKPGPDIEVLRMTAVGPNKAYPEDGSDEDNTYAKFTPSGDLELTVANPALHGKFSEGERYYLDFSKAD
ncbi:hypothetical protein [Parvibaculum sp. MBR-TMA-1.3b-4.2]|jgi:hypothetical protein